MVRGEREPISNATVCLFGDKDGDRNPKRVRGEREPISNATTSPPLCVFRDKDGDRNLKRGGSLYLTLPCVSLVIKTGTEIQGGGRGSLSVYLTLHSHHPCATFVITTGTEIPGGRRGEGAYI